MFQLADNMRPGYFLSSEYLKTLNNEKLDRLVSLSRILNTLDSKEDQLTILKLLIETIDSLLEIVVQDRDTMYQKLIAANTYCDTTDIVCAQELPSLIHQQDIIKEAEFHLVKIRQYAQVGLVCTSEISRNMIS